MGRSGETVGGEKRKPKIAIIVGAALATAVLSTFAVWCIVVRKRRIREAEACDQMLEPVYTPMEEDR